MASKRFAVLTDEQKKQILEDSESANTKRCTLTGVNVFKDYLNSKELRSDFIDLPKSELDELLRDFYFEARNKQGDLYKKGTLIGYRYAIQRHLENKRTVDRINIMTDAEFIESKKAFKSVIKDLKRQGKAATDHYPPISDSDLQKAYAYLTEGHLEDAKLLQYKVFLDIMLHFGRRGRENLAVLSRQDFAATQDENGSLYVYQCCDEQTKNHQQDSERSSDGRMYEIKASENCPVRSFIKYIRRLNPKCKVLFQQPRIVPEEKIYYKNIPVGHNKLGKFMSEISIAAKLSTIYTNHSIRATTVHVLDAAQIPSRHIMTVTGHKSETSLKTYSGKTDGATKKLMSEKLSEKTKGQVNRSLDDVDLSISKPDEGNFPNLSMSQTAEVLDDVADFMEDHDNVDDLLRTVDGPTNNYTSQVNVNTRNTSNQFPMPVFYNCNNITIHCHYSNN